MSTTSTSGAIAAASRGHVGTGGDDQAGAAQHAIAPLEAVPGARAGIASSAPCTITRVRPADVTARASRSAGRGRARPDRRSISRAARCTRRKHRWRGQQHAVGALDRERLRRVERRGVVVRGREHVRPPLGQPTPQLPQVVLDAAHLRREVVGDEKVRHDARRCRSRMLRPLRVLGQQLVVARRRTRATTSRDLGVRRDRRCCRAR